MLLGRCLAVNCGGLGLPLSVAGTPVASSAGAALAFGAPCAGKVESVAQVPRGTGPPELRTSLYLHAWLGMPAPTLGLSLDCTSLNSRFEF